MTPFEELFKELKEHKKAARGQDLVTLMLSPEANEKICKILSARGLWQPLNSISSSNLLYFSGDCSHNILDRVKITFELLPKETGRFAQSSFLNHKIEYPTVVFAGSNIHTNSTHKDIVVIDNQMSGTKARLYTIKR